MNVVATNRANVTNGEKFLVRVGDVPPGQCLVHEVVPLRSEY